MTRAAALLGRSPRHFRRCGDLPDQVKQEVSNFAEIDVAWSARVPSVATDMEATAWQRRARAIFAAVAGANLMARSRSDISGFDALFEDYRDVGLLPAQRQRGRGS